MSLPFAKDFRLPEDFLRGATSAARGTEAASPAVAPTPA
mgnify:CR=1 FL=1